MRLAVISDTHFGDSNCTLTDSNQPISDLPYYQKLIASLVGEKRDSKLDYLVLLGDILDFSITDYSSAYTAAKLFFRQLAMEKDSAGNQLINEIIYVPGNHDFDIWGNVEQQVRVINKIIRGDVPDKYKMSVTGIIDDRADAKDKSKLLLDGVSDKSDKSDKTETTKYGGLFLDFITKESDAQKPQVKGFTFSFAYPNLYLITDAGNTILLTHGQYLESFWSYGSEWFPKIMDIEHMNLNTKDVIGLNFPLSQLSCTGIGQAGDLLTPFVRKIQLAVYDKDYPLIEKCLKKMVDSIKQQADLNPDSVILKKIMNVASDLLIDYMMEKIKKIEKTKLIDDLMADKDVQHRFDLYFRASLIELDSLNRSAQFYPLIPDVKDVIFGHTHHPIAWSNLRYSHQTGGTKVYLHNTGSWLMDEGKFTGAEIFIYESNKGMKSVTIQ